VKKTLFFLLLTLGVSTFHCQWQDSVPKKETYLKGNALFLPIGILNAGVERQLNNKMTLQADVFISPWKSFAGKYLQIYMFGVDGRYYFREAFDHWYLGANISTSRFILQKWNYWGSGTYRYTEDSPEYTVSDLYQDGYSLMLGATVGYQKKIAERWTLDFYVTAGTVQSFYKGLHKKLPVRYDTDKQDRYNRSGEFLPYRGGVMVAYKL